ncbi:outer membrane beta-barrel protein [Pelagicoccus sp. SDUM812003]|uniref:outer membrane beta-barrel protein n=1 Tax=Pelagicoccus sp. SDUM812003 TaxID=3041267 RepID=UPI00280C4DC3|nr:outer membrane beta-barrel protein [Pelagicoccus sp. SDUM812003]MDQ8203590.1 outer membrane beta-barrel protein [Pelagicoccus sp. SDUM812003]
MKKAPSTVSESLLRKSAWTDPNRVDDLAKKPAVGWRGGLKLFTLAFVSLSGVAALEGALKIGSDAVLTTEVQGVAEYHSNVFRRDKGLEVILPVEDDWIREGRVRFNLSNDTEESAGQARLTSGVRQLWFSENSQLDTALFDIEGLIGYEGARVRSSLSSFYVENSLPDEDLRDDTGLLDRSNFKVNWDTTYQMTGASIFKFRADYSDITYEDPPNRDFNDRSSYGVNTKLLFDATSRFNVGLGGKARWYSVDIGSDWEDAAMFLSVEADVAADFELEANLGYGSQSFDMIGIESKDSVFAAISAKWNPTADTDLGVGFEKDFDSGGTGNALEYSRAEGFWRWRVSNALTVDTRAIYLERSYQANEREDNILRTTAALRWDGEGQWFGEFRLSYDENDSSILGFSYEDFVTRLMAGYRW